MTIWKLASAYFTPALILVSLLGGHFFSQVGLLEKWFLGENDIRQVVSFPPAVTPSHNGNQMDVTATANKWPAGANGSPVESKFDDDVEHDWLVKEYEDSVKTAHRTAQAYFNHALEHKQSGQVEQAIQAYEQALTHQRDFPEALLNLGALHYGRRDWQKAREAFKAAALLDRNYAKAHFNLSLAHCKLGELDEAEQAARQALALDSGNAETYNLLGLIHTVQGDYDAAVSVYKEGLAVNDKDANLRSNLSLAYRKMARGNRDEKNL